MDPLTLGIAAVSIGMQVFGGVSASEKAAQAASIQKNIAGLDENANAQRQTAMEIDARRKGLENFRQSQRLQATSLNNATGSGSQYGSGYAGGQAQVTDQGLFNAQGINQNLEIGQKLFGIDNQIDEQKKALSGVQSDMATDQSISNLGATIGKNAGTASNIFSAGASGVTSFGNAVGNAFIPAGALSGGR